MISKEQEESIKKQLIQQIESTFPEDKKAAAISQINSMNENQLEEFLKVNNLVSNNGKNAHEVGQKCIFCSIANKETESVEIDENKNAVAVLEINPISTGHTLIIPKKHTPDEKSIPKSAFSLAKKVAEKLKKLSPKKIDIVPSNAFGHSILNVIPVYENETINSARHPEKKENLIEIRETILKKAKKTIRKPKTEKIKENLWLPRRVP